MIKDNTAQGMFINLVRSVINGEKPPSLPEGVTAEDIFETGYNQSMVTMALCALNASDSEMTGENRMKYLSIFSAGCMNSEEQMSEYHRLTEYLCKNGVKILPLKGCVIKELYPDPALRSMCDVDLLYKGVEPEELARLMEEFGYVTESLKTGCHDIFYRENSVSFELHRKLIRDESPYKSVLENMFDKAIPDENIPNLYHMKPEDLYIHVIAHAAKHLKASGLGIRPVLDIYVLNRKYNAEWDSEYIKKQLKSVRLDRFEAKIRETAYAFFGDEEKEVSKEDMDFFFRAGVYGVHHDVGWYCMGKGGKSHVGFFLKRTLLPYSSMREQFPVLAKHSVLLPVFWIYRVFDVLLHKRQNIVSIASTDINRKDAEYVTGIIKSFGLNK